MIFSYIQNHMSVCKRGNAVNKRFDKNLYFMMVSSVVVQQQSQQLLRSRVLNAPSLATDIRPYLKRPDTRAFRRVAITSALSRESVSSVLALFGMVYSVRLFWYHSGVPAVCGCAADETENNANKIMQGNHHDLLSRKARAGSVAP